MEITQLANLTTQVGAELLRELGEYSDTAALSQASRLRTRYPADLVGAALTQARLRGRAREKFGADAAVMFFTPDGLEQATRRPVAGLRAARYAGAGVRRVADLCCGIGGDALAFASAGMRVLAADRDPLTCAVVQANAEALGLADRIEVRCAEAAEVSLDGCDAVFLDPARRTARGRVFDPDAYSPPWSFALSLADRVEAAGFKVAPGLPHELIPAGAQAQWVSDHGDVKEAGIYFGPLAPALRDGSGTAGGGARTATLLPQGATLESRGAPDPQARAVGRYLYEPDGAVIRAHLIGELAEDLGAHTIDPTIAYLSSDSLVATPFAAPYEVCDVLPFQVKRLKALVAERGYGTLTIKKRGADVDPAALRAQLKPRGPHAAVVIVTRVSGEHRALIAREL